MHPTPTTHSLRQILILLLLTLSSLLYAKTQPILKLDTGGHTAMIKDIIVTKSGDIVTASNDKTIRVWDSKTGKEKRKILGEIGEGSEGKIYAIALSPDEKYLAVGGIFAGEQRSDKTAIRIYNYQSGKLLKVLKSHNDVVHDLSFSENGKFLISGSSDKTAKIWKSPNFSLVDTISYHSRQVYAVKIIKKRDNYYAITAGYDNKIALYDMQKRKVIKSQSFDYNLDYLATSSKEIATCGSGREIVILDFDLNIKKIIHSETKPSGLSYSPNEKFLIAGAGAYPLNVNIYNTKDYSLVNSFKKHTNLTMAVAFLDNQRAVSGGGNNSEIYIWDIKTLKVKRKIEGVGARVWSVGIRGDEIGWGNVLDIRQKNKNATLRKNINLITFQISERGLQFRQGLKSPFQRISTAYKNYSLIHSRGGDYGYSDGVLKILKNGEVVSKIVRDTTTGLRHRCYGFYKNYIISGGNYGFLKIYNLKGKEIANLVGHTETVWSIAIDGDRLVSGSGDQTIRVWDLNFLGAGTSVSESTTRVVAPILTLFISKDNEWVLWSQRGYYNASARGARYIGYHINQGADKEAYFVTSDKHPDLYRPDIIDLIIAGHTEKEAIRLAGKKRKVRTVDVAAAMPPILTLSSPSHVRTDKESVTLSFSTMSKSPIQKWILTRNGEQITKRAIRRAQKESSSGGTITVDLVDGENIIALRARNKYAVSDPLIVTVTKTTRTQNIYKPSLYLLSIGVSQYKNTEYNLNFADTDAKSIAAMFQKQEGKIYKKVSTRLLLNREATSDNILDALDWIEQETTQRDVAMIFIAGHGENDDKGNYYFLGHDAKAAKLRRTAIRWNEIKDTIASLPSKVILLADTCHSGNIMGDRRRGDITGAVKSILDNGGGSIVMTASTGRGYSVENPDWGHGAFTKALLEGIDKSKADYNHDQAISIKEIDLYVTERVKTLTHGKQKPTTIVPQSIPDFMVGVE